MVENGEKGAQRAVGIYIYKQMSSQDREVSYMQIEVWLRSKYNNFFKMKHINVSHPHSLQSTSYLPDE